ncbi:tyrosine-protein phosphatase [Streptomyces sp. SID5910]|uniref:tyrosine-protein phosphatase n=1 Tax=Streptomyces sp. SID5910 TaxID=2690312 RepID=UPI0031F96FED
MTTTMVTAVVLGCLPLWSGAGATAAPPAAAATHDAGPASPAVRRIVLQGAVNVRDLGGYRTGQGRQVRYGQVFRADSLGELTDADLAKLSALRLRTVVDFRVPSEVRGDGADRLPAGPAAVSRPVNDLGLYAKVTEAIGTADPAAQRGLLGDGKAARLMRDIYRTFVTDPATRRQFGATLRDLTRRGPSPLLYHCTSGKDRTGWMSYVLLRAVGIPAGAAERDYLLSNRYRADADRATREGLRKAGLMQNPDLLLPVQEVRREYLEAALAQVERDYGGFHRYLTEGLGLDTSTLARLRARLLR